MKRGQCAIRGDLEHCAIAADAAVRGGAVKIAIRSQGQPSLRILSVSVSVTLAIGVENCGATERIKRGQRAIGVKLENGSGVAATTNRSDTVKIAIRPQGQLTLRIRPVGGVETD